MILVTRGTLLPCAANRSILLSTEQKSACVNKGVELNFYQAYDTLEDSDQQQAYISNLTESEKLFINQSAY